MTPLRRLSAPLAAGVLLTATVILAPAAASAATPAHPQHLTCSNEQDCPGGYEWDWVGRR